MYGVIFQVPSTRASSSPRQELGWSLCFMVAHGCILSRLVLIFKSLCYHVPDFILGIETREPSSKVPSAFGVREESFGGPREQTNNHLSTCWEYTKRECLGLWEPMAPFTLLRGVGGQHWPWELWGGVLSKTGFINFDTYGHLRPDGSTLRGEGGIVLRIIGRLLVLGVNNIPAHITVLITKHVSWHCQITLAGGCP